MEGVNVCWVEEAQSISDNSLDILIPTIRLPNSQVIFTFNRFTELDPVFVRFVMNKPYKTLVKMVNYDVLEKAGLLSDEMKQEIEEDKKTPARYAHIWLGEPLGQADSAILNRSDVLEAMSRKIDDDGIIEVGVDVARMGDDRSVFWMRKGLKTIKKATHHHKRTTELCDLLEDFIDRDKSVRLKIDDTGVGGGVTDEMKKRGYNVLPINFGGSPGDKDKYPNLISEAWFHLRDIIKQSSLPQDRDLLMELTTRQWKQDVKGKRCIESKTEYKKRGFRSPDLADACIICYYTPLVPESKMTII